jgi:hypothetical protein
VYVSECQSLRPMAQKKKHGVPLSRDGELFAALGQIYIKVSLSLCPVVVVPVRPWSAVRFLNI